MKNVKAVLLVSIMLGSLVGCENESITPKSVKTFADEKPPKTGSNGSNCGC